MADDEEAGVGGWVVPAAIDLWSASFCPAGSGNPARGGLRQFQAPNTITAAARRCLESTTVRQPPIPRGTRWRTRGSS